MANTSQKFPISPVSTVILAGGYSRRMGQDKALLRLNGMPLLQQIYQQTQGITASGLIVTAWPERYHFLHLEHCQWIKDDYTAGPLLGFWQALAHIQTDWVLLLACDLPCLDRPTIAEWLQQLDRVVPEAIAYLPRHPKGWEPLCGFYRSSCYGSLQDFVQRGGRSFQTWLAPQTIQELRICNPQVLWNCNTPEDWSTVAQPS